ncbi:hypothetical protein BME96_09005 [Virgibacillus halodenitrificans]|uniref:Uncharacterized protein n=1 Tax=Virgibacillus halodenitrificans TaxID=1482 RepID=A0AAC9NL54_VIRHA|nr:hypothetical protein [Virgibacillus halodenitrificans]APC48296.1 hypothetical protein BME96_09005 [Virgibacillus halodenitrificans]
MKFILCQPAIKRFEWELEVCLTRLKSLGVNDIVLLFTKNDDRVPKKLQEQFTVDVHVYEDNRKDKTYIPSVKPYLWTRYLEEDPTREEGVYFYLDSDVILREEPNIKPTESTWYASDCEGYLGIDYVGELLEPMCNAIDIDPELIRKEKPTGGAQWVIENPSLQYWQKVYEDSIELYRFLKDKDIQKWTAEMWAQLWNVYLFDIKVETPNELDFCWPTDSITRYQETKILHNAGVIDDQQGLFFKGKYVKHTPFTDVLNANKNKASYEYLKAIKEVHAMKYKVLHYFEDLQDDNKPYNEGDVFPRPANKKVTKKRLQELASAKNKQGKALIEKVEEQD